jgi:two-component sensor histidine kinase
MPKFMPIRILPIPALYLCLMFCGVPESSSAQNKAYTDSLVFSLTNAKNDTPKINTLLAISHSYKTTDITKEFYYANKALNLSEKINWSEGVMFGEELIGDSYSNVMDYEDAIQHLKLSIIVSRKLQRPDVEATCLKMIVFASYKMSKYDDMVFYQKALLELAERVGEPANISTEMNSYALRLSDAGRYREAISYWQQNIAFTEKHLQGVQKDILLATILNTLACTYVKTNQFDSALYCLRTATRLASKTDDYFLKSYIMSTLCDVYESSKRYDSAEIYGLRTVQMGEISKNLDLQQHYCETLSRVYAADNKPTPALYYHKKFDSLINIISNTGKIVDQAMQLAKINIDQQEEQNRLEKRSFATVRHNQRAALLSMLVALIALIALTIFIYLNLRNKQKANKTISRQAASLQAQNEIIDKALKDKEMLLKETHHRVKNNLQLVSSLLELQTENIADQAAKSALLAAQRRVLSIATVHSKLYGSDENEAIEFSGFASDLLTRLDNAFGDGDGAVHFINAIPTTYLPLDTVVLLGLILNELITNSYKHAFKGVADATIAVSMNDTESMHVLRYSDNGKGLPDGVFERPSASLGLYLVKRLSKQLKGTATYSFDKGSVFTIIFPYATS